MITNSDETPSSNGIGSAIEQRLVKPDDWHGLPFRWIHHDFVFDLHGIPIHWEDCHKPSAFRTSEDRSFHRRVLSHPIIGWLILETYTIGRDRYGRTETGEYTIRRASEDECVNLFHDDPRSTLLDAQRYREKMAKYFHRSGHRIKL